LLDESAEEQLVYQADAIDVLKYVPQATVDLVVTSPPYWDILNEKRSADYKDIRNYGNYERDLGCISDYTAFLCELKRIFQEIFLCF
jgi:DNA modification methylase